MKILILFLIRYLVFAGEIWTVYKLEKSIRPEKKMLMISAAILLLTAILGCEKNIAVEAVGSFFWGSLIAAAYSDFQIKQVYNFFLYIGLFAAAITMIAQGIDIKNYVVDIIIFSLLQMFLFGRMYGKADCMSFVVCAVFFTAYGSTRE